MNKDNLNRMFTIGTPQCGAFSAFCGVVLAVLLLTIGLWKTLFIFLFAALGLFIGLCKDKKGAVRRGNQKREGIHNEQQEQETLLAGRF